MHSNLTFKMGHLPVRYEASCPCGTLTKRGGICHCLMGNTQTGTPYCAGPGELEYNKCKCVFYPPSRNSAASSNYFKGYGAGGECYQYKGAADGDVNQYEGYGVGGDYKQYKGYGAGGDGYQYKGYGAGGDGYQYKGYGAGGDGYQYKGYGADGITDSQYQKSFRDFFYLTNKICPIE